MTTQKHPRIVNVEDAEPITRSKGRFSFQSKRLAAAAGAKQIGVNWMELPPGKTSFPFHYHTGIEEGAFILAGTGNARIGKDSVDIKPGDYIAYPAGPDHAHTITNTGQEPLQYLVFSTQNVTDIIGYPDSKKFAFGAIPDPTTWPKGMWVQKLIKDQESVDYFEGEDLEEPKK